MITTMGMIFMMIDNFHDAGYNMVIITSEKDNINSYCNGNDYCNDNVDNV